MKKRPSYRELDRKLKQGRTAAAQQPGRHSGIHGSVVPASAGELYTQTVGHGKLAQALRRFTFELGIFPEGG